MSSTISAAASPRPWSCTGFQNLACVFGQLVNACRRVEARRLSSAFVTGAQAFTTFRAILLPNAPGRAAERVFLEDATRRAEQEELDEPRYHGLRSLALDDVDDPISPWGGTSPRSRRPRRRAAWCPRLAKAACRSPRRSASPFPWAAARFTPHASCFCTRPSNGRAGRSRCRAPYVKGRVRVSTSSSRSPYCSAETAWYSMAGVMEASRVHLAQVMKLMAMTGGCATAPPISAPCG